MAKTKQKPATPKAEQTPVALRDRIKEIKRVRAGDLIPNPKNWRTHNSAQRSALKGILADVGIADAAIAYETKKGLMLIDGHLRIDTDPEQIWPVLVLDVTEEEADKLLATLDPLSAMAGTDAEKAAALIKSIDTTDEGLRGLLSSLADNATTLLAKIAGEVDQDSIPAPPDKATTQLGDLWILGEHRLLCGDATNAAEVAAVMDGQTAVLMSTDPPYGINYTDEERVAADRAHGRRQRKTKWDEGIENDGVDGAKLQAFLETVIRTAVPHLADKAAFYLWHPMLTQGTFFAAAAAAAADILIHRQIIWVKPSLLLGFGDYHWRHELCFYGWRRGHRPKFYGERNQTTVWELKHDTAASEREHPTAKPVELFARPITNHTQAGDVVYDPFAGSGPQFIAAEQLGRRCYGVEIEPKYCDVIVARWETLTGKKAKRQRA